MSKLNLEIRRAHIQDAAEVHRIMRAAFEEYCGKLSPPSGARRETIEDVSAALRSGGAFLAEIDGVPVGKCTVSSLRRPSQRRTSGGTPSTPWAHIRRATTSTSHSARELFSGEDRCQSPHSQTSAIVSPRSAR